jgi:cyclopropane-fatty-acyl-phospholipid synthase
MDLVHARLRDGGRFLLQTFISSHSVQRCNEWFDRYIFPNGVSPSLRQLDAAATPSFGAPVGEQDIGTHYAPTLLAWDRNVEARWNVLSARYPERFRRMWHFYLTCLAGIFRARGLGLYQLVYDR